MSEKEEFNLEDELDLRVRGNSAPEAMLNLNQYLMENYGVLFNMRVLEPMRPESFDAYGVKWRVKIEVGRMKIPEKPKGDDHGDKT